MATGGGHKLHGKNGAIYFDGPVGTGIKVSTKTEWTLNLNRDYVDSTVFGQTQQDVPRGPQGHPGHVRGPARLSMVTTRSTRRTRTPSTSTSTPTTASTTATVLIALGPGLIDAAITASNTDAIKTTGNFRAAGAWTVFSDGSL